MLILAGAIIPQIRRPAKEDDSDGSDIDDLDDDEPSPRRPSASTQTNAKTPKNVRGKKEDSDSDFEFDL